ncbi:Protein SMAX1-like 4 [Vitis vinifera]|uniref:Protein SMAX1-like 4 n=1 Tax=Vitis vinifera TaxID=29760 RepID=A0A438BZ59_VITVI|nr:Protein SMAX1-like 4 [Vitis vinifera]
MNMRKLDNGVTPCSEILTEALRAHQKLVVMVEDVDFAEPQFMKFLADGCETGEFRDSSKEKEINLTIPTLGTPNMDHKRKAEWDLSNRTKSPRTDEEEGSCLISVEPGNSKILEFTRQLSFNTLDLNIRADEDDESKDKPRELSPISSDLTRETATDIQNPHGFLESIENRFTFKRKADQDREMREAFLSKIKGSFEVGYDSENTVSFSVEQKLLEEVLAGCDSFLNSLFEKWLKEVFQTSVKTVKIGGKEGMEVRLRLVGKGEKGLEDGFMGSSLPKKIQVSFMD